MLFIDTLIENVADTRDRARIAETCKRCGHHRAINAMLRLARFEPEIVVEPGFLDQRPHLLNCLNGTVDLTTGEFRPHLRADLLTHMMEIEYRPDPSIAPKAGLRQWCRRLGMNAELCHTLAGFTGSSRVPEFDPGLSERGSLAVAPAGVPGALNPKPSGTHRHETRGQAPKRPRKKRGGR